MREQGIAYLLWLTCCFGFCGIHRFYLDSYITGFFWLITFGLFGCGQLLDLLLIPGMVDSCNLRYGNRGGGGGSTNNNNNNNNIVINTVQSPPVQQQPVYIQQPVMVQQPVMQQPVMQQPVGYAPPQPYVQQPPQY